MTDHGPSPTLLGTPALKVVGFDPLRDKTYQSTRLGRDVVDFLAWLELGGTAPRTLDQYERDLARGALLFPNKGIADLEDGDALHIARQFKPGERRVRVAAWRSFYKWALRSRRVTLNPFDALPAMKKPKKTVYDIFSEPECAALTGLPVRDGALMQILIDAGARKADARHLQLQHYRPEPSLECPYGVVVFKEGKGGNDRQVPATQALAQKLNELALVEGLSPSDYVWYSMPANGVSRRIKRSQPIGDGTFARWWRSCLTGLDSDGDLKLPSGGVAANVRYRNPHMTRHTFATRWLRRGGRLETLSVAMGHASIKTTFDLYGHLVTRDVGADLILIESR